MTLSMLAGPQLEPISVAEAKLFLRIDDEAENEVIAALITTARLHVERLTRRIVLNQTWRFYLDDLPQNSLVKLGIGPVREVLQVVSFNREGNPSVVPAEDYIVDVSSVPARIKFRNNTRMLPTRSLNGYEIDFIAGFGPTTLQVPADLRQAILMLVVHWYENRSAVATDVDLISTPKGVNDLIQPYRVVNL
ncbi:MAG: head-tail connector protein [Hyphomicrobiales bacterium]